ncbi:GatB/YqeY domain-containing protein [Elizabethkingia argentiflava]|uniref:GatB/YqeY domain-containing protein n=1 Tax=Elizabethkingia argenteiflava TaxID=2681556 RepID=A0A845PZR2_9FLAO|nr:GatB/YqeY domain-containing protein [Elizabethkingia argenteiflava]NAW52296.1 GatB/YqeY domain-containing protein [Elizabethkingia argenteiflava]
MSLESQVMDAIKRAMKEKDRVALDALRAIKAQILLSKIEGKGVEIGQDQEIVILQRMLKQRKDSIQQFEAQQRQDLAEVEASQIRVIEKFLPVQLSDEELETEVRKIILEMGAIGVKDLGKVMAIASKTLLGKSDGKRISEIAKKLLA